MFVVGTRAQLIKVAPVLRRFELDGIPSRLWLTGQHAETMQDLLAEFAIETPPELLLDTTERSSILKLAGWAPRALLAIRRALLAAGGRGEKPYVLAHGDTASTALAALAARSVGCAIAHLESGLTSNRLFDPFPEEMTRRVAFRLCDVAFCPSDESMARMARYRCERVHTRGNTILDALRLALAREAGSEPEAQPYAVVSLHRFQNLYPKRRFLAIVDALAELSRSIRLVMVLHPVTRRRLARTGRFESLAAEPGLDLRPRMPYGDFVRLLARADFVLSDGGSNQEELALLGVPTVVLRDATERSDGLGRNAALATEVSAGAWLAMVERLRTSGSVAPLASLPSPSEEISRFVASAFAAAQP